MRMLILFGAMFLELALFSIPFYLTLYVSKWYLLLLIPVFVVMYIVFILWDSVDDMFEPNLIYRIKRARL
jgi:hypothetical protein